MVILKIHLSEEGKRGVFFGTVSPESWGQVFTGVPRLKFRFSKVSSKPWSFVLDPRDSSLFLLGVSLALRLAHGNTWISPRRDIKDGYSCIIRIIVSMTKSTEFIHSQDVFFSDAPRWEAEKVFYWSSAKLQNQVHPEDKFSIRLAVFQPGELTSKPLTFWTLTTLLFSPFNVESSLWMQYLKRAAILRQIGELLRFFPKTLICAYVEPSAGEKKKIYIFTTSNYKDIMEIIMLIFLSPKVLVTHLTSDQMPHCLAAFSPVSKESPESCFLEENPRSFSNTVLLLWKVTSSEKQLLCL